MNIIITSENLRHSVSFRVSLLYAFLLLLLALSLGFFAFEHSVLGTAEEWIIANDQRVQAIVTKVHRNADQERRQLWKKVAASLDEQAAALRIKLWRLGSLGDLIAKRIGLPDEVLINEKSLMQDSALGLSEDSVTAIAEVTSKINMLGTKIAKESRRFNQLAKEATVVAMHVATVPRNKAPIDGNYRLTSGMGYRKDPFTGRRVYHSGYDYAASRGTPVLAGADGVVTYVGRLGNYGKTIDIYHGSSLSTRYGHLLDYRVRAGDFVTGSKIIALIGSTGRSTGPHLHYEVRYNNRPKTYKQIAKISKSKPSFASLQQP